MSKIKVREKKFIDDIIFLVGTHGNERLGLKTIRKINSQKTGLKLNYILVNQRAYQKNVRYIKNDINRIAPGNIKSRDYETRRVAQVIQLSKKYRFVIDIHNTKAATGIFTIVTKPTKENLALAAALPPKNIVIWEFPSPQMGAVTQFVKCGVEIECGPTNSYKIKKDLYAILMKIRNDGIKNRRGTSSNKKWFRVYGSLDKGKTDEKIVKKLKEFKKIKIKTETFFPLLIGRYTGIICQKMMTIKAPVIGL